jgi:hypothetical protein
MVDHFHKARPGSLEVKLKADHFAAAHKCLVETRLALRSPDRTARQVKGVAMPVKGC